MPTGIYDRHNKTKIKIKCKICNKDIWISPYRKNIPEYCSNKCTAVVTGFQKGHKIGFQKGNKNFMWQGGKYKGGHGYIFVLQKEHPFCYKKGYVLEHRLVVEKQIGRYLKLKECVHHINKIRGDNRPQNLIAFVNKGYHLAFHRFGYCNPKGIIFDGRDFSSS